MADVITGAETPTIEENVERCLLVADVRTVVATLPAREPLVIQERYGLYGRPRTLCEIGDELGLSRERVRQLERSGLALLHQTTRHRALLPWTG